MVIENVKTRKSSMISQEKANKNLSEKAARAEKAAAVWNRNKIFEGKIAKLSEADRRASGINLTNQARFMKRLTESELSTEFSKMAPVNVMKLVERTYTNVNRGNVFATFQMETANDALYYLKHHFDAPFAFNNGKSTFDWKNRADMMGETDADVIADPYGFNKKLTAKDSSNNTYYGDTRKSVYDARQDRYANELQNGTVDTTPATGSIASVTFENDAFKGGERIIPGYITVYTGDNPQTGLVAFQDQSTYEFYIDAAYADKITVEEDAANHKVLVKAKEDDATAESIFGEGVVVNAFARFNSEDDYEGESMGEVTVMLSTYNFRPHRTSVGASWTHLSAITLGASYQQELDDLLLKGAADVIQAQLDYRSFKEAYQIARTNPGQFTVEFDCAYTGTQKDDDGSTVLSKDGYVDNAQTLGSAIQILSSAIYEVRQQGSINNMVAGLSAVAYIRLNAGFSTKGAQKPCGVFKVGELDGTPVYQAPQAVIPTKEILCIYKNDEVENDAAIVIATLIPFVSNKLDYPTFYTRAGLATYGDRVILNRNYLGRIILKNLKDAFVEGQVK